MKIKLQNNCCELRFTCKNIDKKCCNPIAKKNQNYVECNNYKVKAKENIDTDVNSYEKNNYIFLSILMALVIGVVTLAYFTAKWLGLL